jgi:hypothetical protein
MFELVLLLFIDLFDSADTTPAPTASFKWFNTLVKSRI